jgi:hypothetical protein
MLSKFNKKADQMRKCTIEIHKIIVIKNHKIQIEVLEWVK